MSADPRYVIPQPPQPALAVAGSKQLFPVRRIWCVGRNYLEHIREMGQDEREPPFFFAKPADAIVPDGSTVPYPPLTKDMHFEVELVVALKSGGGNIPVNRRWTTSGVMASASTSPAVTCRSPRARSSAPGRSGRRSMHQRPAGRCVRRPTSAIRARDTSGSRRTARSVRTGTSRR